MYEMKPEFYIGVESIDNEHKRLFEITDEIYQLMMDPYTPDKYDNILSVLEQLKEYTRLHFENEEKYMESIAYKYMFSQKVDHAAFIEKLENIDLDEIDTDQDKAIFNLLNFLNDWLVTHILEKDLLIVQ